MRSFAAAIALTLAAAPMLVASPVRADEPDGLILPAGFHATVVADGLTGARHLAVRDNGDIYVSTAHGQQAPSVGIYALRLGPDHTATETQHFGAVDQGTGIRFYKGALYAASGTGISRFSFSGNELVPTAAPEVIVDGLTGGSHGIALDGKGNLFVSISGGGGENNCSDPNAPKDAKPVGQMPCPLLATRGGLWRFDDSKAGQKFADGEHYATGIRNTSALDWRGGDALYSVMHGRDGTAKNWPDLVTAAQDDAIPDEMTRFEKGTDQGWPYTYYDGQRNIRLMAPEYGGDGKTPVTDSKYAVPVVSFQPQRPAALDIAFYNGSKFPRSYRGGAFVPMHGGNGDRPDGHGGYNVMFVPFSGNGKAGTPVVFAEGFAGPAAADKNTGKAKYRPSGVAVGPDGALYVLETQKGRLWRIAYGN
jgi:glucose/arabinose dehydrogenase